MRIFYVEHHPDTVRSPGLDGPLGGGRDNSLRQGSLLESAAGRTYYLLLNTANRLPPSLARLTVCGNMQVHGRYLIIGELVMAQCPCCDAIDADTRYDTNAPASKPELR